MKSKGWCKAPNFVAQIINGQRASNEENVDHPLTPRTYVKKEVQKAHLGPFSYSSRLLVLIENCVVVYSFNDLKKKHSNFFYQNNYSIDIHIFNKHVSELVALLQCSFLGPIFK